MSAHTTTRRLGYFELTRMKATGEKIAMLTCYDASFARACDAAGIDIILVGDSLGNVVQGHETTLPVTVEQIVYHTACVVRGCTRPLIVADLPFGSFLESPQTAYRNAATLMAAGAQMVKLEGGASVVETTRFLASRGVPVCAHVGLTPQSVHQLGGFRVQGKDEAGAVRLRADALAQQEAGAVLIVLEAIPAPLAAEITDSLFIPTIGIGAGKECSGQVLVMHDALDVAPGRKPRFVRNFMAGQDSITGAFTAYVTAVKDGSFPGPEHCY
ncbi:MAG: 3-methyl-2-oxobutanoate hydroxymethyltransferase [Candidatus Accumulibacter sp.]|jgi:3-methyl-2-oxobutanoate hydroxymethyltransferase|nr:3-methyl-2-oxobutanoate hydroxymethyltransferase [Accumulibacter sp.]